jgi:hypothetical protein
MTGCASLWSTDNQEHIESSVGKSDRHWDGIISACLSALADRSNLRPVGTLQDLPDHGNQNCRGASADKFDKVSGARNAGGPA